MTERQAETIRKLRLQIKQMRQLLKAGITRTLLKEFDEWRFAKDKQGEPNV